MCINAFGLMFGQISLYKLVHFQPPPLQLTALPQSINMVSAFCWPYTPSANKLYSHLRNISKSITVSGAACVVVVSGWVVDQVRFRAGITFAKPNEWVQIWVQGRGWEDRAQYKKRLRKVSCSDSIRSNPLCPNDPYIIGASTGVVQGQRDGAISVWD